MKQVPNIFTLLNLLFGCLAIVATLQNGITIQYLEDGTQLVNVAEKIWLAPLFIGIAAIIDFLDGFVARLFRAESEIGKQLDSLADVVSFGVAPSMIVYQFLRLAWAKEIDGLDSSYLWLVPAFFIAMAGAYRLARYNVESNDSAVGFSGVPIPAAGLLVASLPLIYWNSSSETIIELIRNRWFLYTLIIVVSWLMISRLPLMAFKFKDKSVKANMPFLILAGLSIVFVLLFQWLAVPLIFAAYIILSLVFKHK